MSNYDPFKFDFESSDDDGNEAALQDDVLPSDPFSSEVQRPLPAQPVSTVAPSVGPAGTSLHQPNSGYHPPAPGSPQLPYGPPYQQTYPQPYPPPYAYGYPTKDRSLALILEVAFGFFGFLGIGWMYAGEFGRGCGTMIAYWVWGILVAVLLTFTLGVGCIITLPLNLIFIAFSASALSGYAKQRPDLFRP